MDEYEYDSNARCEGEADGNLSRDHLLRILETADPEAEAMLFEDRPEARIYAVEAVANWIMWAYDKPSWDAWMIASAAVESALYITTSIQQTGDMLRRELARIESTKEVALYMAPNPSNPPAEPWDADVW